MEWLRNAGFESVSPAQWRAWCEDGRQLPAKPVILTFDDGFSDLEQHAFPVLERLGLTATVFLVTREIGGTNEWDRVKGMRNTIVGCRSDKKLGSKGNRVWRTYANPPRSEQVRRRRTGAGNSRKRR